MLNNFYFKNLLKSSLHSKGFRKWEINDKTDLVCYCWDIKRKCSWDLLIHIECNNNSKHIATLEINKEDVSNILYLYLNSIKGAIKNELISRSQSLPDGVG